MHSFLETVNPLRDKIDQNAYTTTHSGIHFPYSNFGLQHIKLCDIATHLSKITRWLGAMEFEHYSVTEHSVLLARYAYQHSDEIALPNVTPEKIALGFLMHDSDEYITGDFPSPLKRLCPELVPYGDFVRSAVYAKFDIPIEVYKLVKPYDIRIRVNEAQYVRNGSEITDDNMENMLPLPVEIQGWDAGEAQAYFIDTFAELF